MEFISVSLARLVAIVSVEALDPRGHVSGPEIFYVLITFRFSGDL